MARLRTIKPGFFTNEDLATCSPLARLLFAGLWTIADREGRLEDRPARIKTQILPYDACDATALLSELAARGFIVRYRDSGHRYLYIPTFKVHQRPHPREAASLLPAPDQAGKDACQQESRERDVPGNGQGAAEPRKGSDEQCGVLSLGSGVLGLGSGVLDQEETHMSGDLAPDVCPEPRSDQVTDTFRAFWSTYSRKEKKPAALGRWRHMSASDREAALIAAGHYARYAAMCPDDPLMLPATFLSRASRAWEDWVAGIPESRLRGSRTRASPAAGGISSEQMRAVARSLRERRGED